MAAEALQKFSSMVLSVDCDMELLLDLQGELELGKGM